MSNLKSECTECHREFIPVSFKFVCSLGCRTARTKRQKHEKYIANAEEVKAKARQYRLGNPEKIREMRTNYKENYPDRIRKSNQKQYWADPEGKRELSRSFRASNPDYIEYHREYRKTNAELVNKYYRQRRASRLGVPTEAYTVQLILDTYGTLCHICTEEIDLNASRRVGIEDWHFGLHLDHVIPLCVGGSDLIENVQPSHALCNLRKGKTTYSGTPAIELG